MATTQRRHRPHEPKHPHETKHEAPAQRRDDWYDDYDNATVGRHLSPARVAINGAKALGDVVIAPGTSLIVQGEVKSGALHVLSGVVARSFFGPIGWLAVGADAYSRAVTGKHIWDLFTEGWWGHSERYYYDRYVEDRDRLEHLEHAKRSEHPEHHE